MAVDQSLRTRAFFDREEANRKREGDERAAVWAFLWTLFAFKIATVVLIFWFSPTFSVGALLGATTWPFLVIPGAAAAGPLLFRYRLRRARARREALRRAEWIVE